MRRLGALLGSSLLLLGFSAGCGGYLGSAQRAYQDGRYLEAAEKLEDHEDEVAELSPRKQVSYGLYMGLSLMRLGDRDGAARWLGFAEEIEAARGQLAVLSEKAKAPPPAIEEPAEDGTLLRNVNVRQTEP